MKKQLFTLLFTFLSLALSAQHWSYIEIDSNKQKWGDWNEPDWLRYFGLDAGDVDHDGDLDILSGRYLYHNPGGNMDGSWQRTVLDDNVDGIFIVDIDNDPFADLIAQALPNIYWYEAVDVQATRFVRKKIAEVPATTHINSQGFEKAQIIPGGKKELLIAGNGNVYLIRIPKNPESMDFWPTKLIGANTSDEGIGVGDVDGDGDLDIVCGRRPDGEEEPKILVWFENEGFFDSPWTNHIIGTTKHPIDRVKVGDLDNDGKVEIVLAEERYPGLEADSEILWFSQNNDTRDKWTKHLLTTQYSSNNLNLVDMDDDGDIDILTAEHKGPKLELQLWMNNGTATFVKTVLDTQKENHLGAKAFDMDHDGDMDIIGAAWDNYQSMHLWKNSSKNRALDSIITKYQGRDHYVIQTKGITYYYDIAGGGFSRMIDNYGNDWISFKQITSDYPQGAAGTFRGIPNMVFQGEDNGAGHPGFNRCRSWFENRKLYSESLNGKWKWRWSFFDHHAVLEVLKTDPSRKYWFLYEGSPGGKFSPANHYLGTDTQSISDKAPDFYKGQAQFQPLRWAYVGSRHLDVTFYMKHLTDTPINGLVSYLGNSKDGIESKDGMTVFGFGRGEDTNALFQGPSQFIIGLYPKEITNKAEHEQFAKFLRKIH